MNNVKVTKRLVNDINYKPPDKTFQSLKSKIKHVRKFIIVPNIKKN